MTKHNKYYHETGRNGWTPSNTFDNKEDMINPKMLLSKDEIMKKEKVEYKFN